MREVHRPSPHTRLFSRTLMLGFAGTAIWFALTHTPFSEGETWYSGASSTGGPPETPPETDLEKVARERMPWSFIPDFFEDVEGAALSASSLSEMEHVITSHITWMDQVIAEYEHLMMTDGEYSIKELERLKAARTELLYLLSDTRDQESELNEAIRSFDRALSGGADPEWVAAQCRMLMQDPKFAHVSSFSEGLKEFYMAAHKISLLEERGIVWVDGVTRPIDDVYGIDFTSSKETQIPRRTARAMFEFFQDNPNADLVVTEGHTGDPSNPTSYKGHKSAGHRFGYSFDVDFQSGETHKNIYDVLKNGEDDPTYDVRYEVKTAAERGRVIAGVVKCAMEDGMSREEAQAFAERNIKAFPQVTGGHFHVEATGRIGSTIDPRGPMAGSALASR